jgi:hypothetical protein
MTSIAAIPPPQDKKTSHEALLNEILKERVAELKSRYNPRGVKRKMSNYPFSPRGKIKTQIMNIEITVVD